MEVPAIKRLLVAQDAALNGLERVGMRTEPGSSTFLIGPIFHIVMVRYFTIATLLPSDAQLRQIVH